MNCTVKMGTDLSPAVGNAVLSIPSMTPVLASVFSTSLKRFRTDALLEFEDPVISIVYKYVLYYDNIQTVSSIFRSNT
jgi:hypothetical protein